MRIVLLGLALAVTSIVVGVDSASAQAVIRAGVSCQPSMHDDGESGLFRYRGRLVSQRSFPLLVQCDVGGRLSWNSPRTLYIDYADGNKTAQVNCTALVVSWSGDVVFEETQQSSVAGVGPGFFRYVLPESAIGYVSVACQLLRVEQTVPEEAGRSSLIGFNLQ